MFKTLTTPSYLYSGKKKIDYLAKYKFLEWKIDSDDDHGDDGLARITIHSFPPN